MEEENILDPLWSLETAYSNIKEDLQMLYYFENSYFIYDKAPENFEKQYNQIRITLSTIIKSIALTTNDMSESIEKIYKERKN